MSDLHIRTARIADASAVTDLLNQEIRTGLAIWRYEERDPAEIENLIQIRLTAGCAAYIAERNQEIIGWASYGPFRAGEGYGQTMEHSVHVASAHRRSGIGRQLMTRLLDHADAAKVHAMIGAIESTNTASIALHAQFGFVEVGRLPEIGWKFDRWLSLILMQRTAT